MDKRYISPYKLVFIEGIGNLCCFIVIMVFYDYIGCFRVFSSCQNIEYVYPFKYFKESFTNYKYLLLMIPTTFWVDVFIILTLKYLTPTFRPMFDMFWVFISLVFNLNEDIDNYGFPLFFY